MKKYNVIFRGARTIEAESGKEAEDIFNEDVGAPEVLDSIEVERVEEIPEFNRNNTLI